MALKIVGDFRRIAVKKTKALWLENGKAL